MVHMSEQDEYALLAAYEEEQFIGFTFWAKKSRVFTFSFLRFLPHCVLKVTEVRLCRVYASFIPIARLLSTFSGQMKPVIIFIND